MKAGSGMPPPRAYTSWIGGQGKHGVKRNNSSTTSEDTAIPLNVNHTELLWKLAREHPAFRTALRESQDLLFGTPFQVAYGTKNGNTTRTSSSSSSSIPNLENPGESRSPGRLLPLQDTVREHIIERHWMPFLREADLWLRLYGVAPWYFRKLDGVKTHESKTRYTKGSSKNSSDRKMRKRNIKKDERTAREGPHGTLFETYVPAMPAFGTGRVETYVTNGQQRFQWRWLESANMSHGRTSMVDKKVQFILEKGSLPDVRGEYRSDMVSMAQDFAFVTTMRIHLLESQRAALFPIHSVEWAPDIAKATSTGGQYSEGDPLRRMGGGVQVAFPSEMTHQQGVPSPLSRVQNERSRSGNGYALTSEADYMVPDMLGETTTSRAGTYLVSPDASQSDVRARLDSRRELLNEHPELREHLASPAEYLRGAPSGRPGLPPNTHILEPYERMVTHAHTHPDMSHLMAAQNRLDQMVAVLADYPLEMIMGMGGKGGGGGKSASGQPQTSTSGVASGSTQQMPQKSGMYQYVISRQRARSSFFTKQVRHIFMMAYGATLQDARIESSLLFASIRGRMPNEREQMELNQQLDIHIFFPRTPLLSFDEMVVYYQHGLFSEDDFRKFALDVIGMEDRAPTEDYKKALKMLYKEPLDLELKKMKAEATMAAQKPAPATDNGGSGSGGGDKTVTSASSSSKSSGSSSSKSSDKTKANAKGTKLTVNKGTKRARKGSETDESGSTKRSKTSK